MEFTITGGWLKSNAFLIKIFHKISLNPAASEDYLSRNWMKTSPGKSDFVQRGLKIHKNMRCYT